MLLRRGASTMVNRFGSATLHHAGNRPYRWQVAAVRHAAAAGTGATTPPPPPPTNPTAMSSSAAADAERIVKKLEGDPELLRVVLHSLTPEARRKLVIAGGALEWFGKDHVSEEVTKADADKDRYISPKDFDKWIENALKRRSATPAGSSAASSSSGAATSDSADPSAVNASATAGTAAAAAVTRIPIGVLLLLALEAGLPFVGFGCLDNASMILAGDAIDRHIGAYFSLSVMATAALGNVVAGMMGMQVHGFIEKLVQSFHLPVPTLTEQQRKSNRVFMAEHLGGTVGIAFGLCLGMTPLYFLEDEHDKADKKAFHQLDKDGDGIITAEELQAALTELGFRLTKEVAEEKMSTFAAGPGAKGLKWEEFRMLLRAEREKHHAPHVAA